MSVKSRGALIALCLLLPMPSLGVWVTLVLYPDSTVGMIFFIFSKLWILVLPLIWFFWVDRDTLQIRRPRATSIAVGLVSGILFALIILITYRLIGQQTVDSRDLKAVAAMVGMNDQAAYLAFAVYWVLVNSLLEEYVWRWFVVRQLRVLVSPGLAIVGAALGFTAHHVVATQLYFSVPLVGLAALGVFSGGVIWSWLTVRYLTIWPAYVSHILADIAIFAIGYQIIFLTPS